MVRRKLAGHRHDILSSPATFFFWFCIYTQMRKAGGWTVLVLQAAPLFVTGYGLGPRGLGAP